MNNLDHISESLETTLGLKLLKFFDADPGSGMEKIRIRNVLSRICTTGYRLSPCICVFSTLFIHWKIFAYTTNIFYLTHCRRPEWGRGAEHWLPRCWLCWCGLGTPSAPPTATASSSSLSSSAFTLVWRYVYIYDAHFSFNFTQEYVNNGVWTLSCTCTLTKKKIKFSSYIIKKFRVEQLQSHI
jgi:hypothetical protein